MTNVRSIVDDVLHDRVKQVVCLQDFAVERNHTPQGYISLSFAVPDGCSCRSMMGNEDSSPVLCRQITKEMTGP